MVILETVIESLWNTFSPIIVCESTPQSEKIGIYITIKAPSLHQSHTYNAHGKTFFLEPYCLRIVYNVLDFFFNFFHPLHLLHGFVRVRVLKVFVEMALTTSTLSSGWD